MKTGFATATGDLILYTDADLPFDMAELPRAVRLMRDYDADIVSAYRFDRTGEGYLRTVYTFIYNLLIRTLFDVKARDINFAFKLCRSRIFEHVQLRSEGSFIDAELERNPLLQRDEADQDAEPAAEADGPIVAEQVADAEARADLDATHDDVSPGERATGDAPEAAADAGGAIDWSKAGSGGSFDQDGEGFEGRLSRELTLSEHLQAQLAASGLSPAETVIAGVLIDAVDESGYLRADIEEVAERLVGSLLPDFYGAYLMQRLETARQSLA